jgi:hypothetical protein
MSLVYSGHMPCPSVYTVIKDFAVPITALIWSVTVWIRGNWRRLSISQEPIKMFSVINRVTEVQGMHTTTFVTTLVITNDSPKANIVISKYQIRPPWNDPEIETLDDPHEAHPRSDDYVLHAASEWPRDWVINHLRYQCGKLAPGDTIRGMLLVRGVAAIPNDLKTSKPIEMGVVITNTRQKEYITKIWLWPEEMPKL